MSWSEVAVLSKIIKKNKIYVATDGFTLLKLSGVSKEVDANESVDETVLYTIKTELGGTVNFKLPATTDYSNGLDFYLVLTDTDGNKEQYYGKINFPSSTAAIDAVKLKANKTYTIGIKPKTNIGRATFSDIIINGIIIDGKALSQI